ncbi:MAG: division/cell wall cluster transcriptional repressor MraZ [Dehalococcoidia bacterium]|nr:division/cell wall cluster transcriptional repressor MraZ [Dehalococcoidia bacterium]
MLSGTFEARVDAQSRIVIPLKFRPELQGDFMLARGPDQNINAYPMREWERLVAEYDQFSDLDDNARIYKRLTIGSGHDVKLDRQGRIVLPTFLRTFSGIADAVVIVGYVRFFELWSAERWQAMEAKGANLSDLANILHQQQRMGQLVRIEQSGPRAVP